MKKEGLEKAVLKLKEGEPVIYPTESCYALGCNAENEDAVKKIYELKKRPTSKPLPVICASELMAEKYAFMNRAARYLADIFWPGPLTLVCDKKETVPDVLNKIEVALRVSENETARELSRKFGGALVSTSANISGTLPSYDGDAVRAIFPGVFMINEGILPGKEVSTIFDTRSKEVLREGAIQKKELRKALKSFREI